MAPWMTTIVAIALLSLVALSVNRLARERRAGPFLLSLSVLAGLAWLLRRFFGFPVAQPIPASKGLTPSELPVIGVLFACMLLGMLAHWLYVWLGTPQGKRRKFDFGRFVAPILASPIIFIPLLASQQNTDLSLAQLDVPRFMVFLVAFENGFFWKEYFDNLKKKAAP
jgi:hypothetical protein